jgi:hypothetical protein
MFTGRAVPSHACVLTECGTAADKKLVDRFLAKKNEQEQRHGRELYINITFELPSPRRTYKQLRTVWKLVTVIFEAMEGRKPDESEKYQLYLDLLDVYGEKAPSKITGKMRPRHLSESNNRDAAKFIEGLMYHLAEYADLSLDLQADVRETLFMWEAWRGGLIDDPLDEGIGESEWRRTHNYSEASGRGGNIELAHIVSRARAPAYAHEPWNWLALTAEEHRMQHQGGWREFLQVYPHLRGRVARAISRAYKLGGEEEVENGMGA